MSAERGDGRTTRSLNGRHVLQRCRLRRSIAYSALSTQITALLLFAGCAIPQVPARVVYEDPVNFVRLEPDPYVLPEWPPSAHSHPAHLGEDLLERILTGLQVQERRIVIQKKLLGLAPREPAFRDEELKLLVPKLAEALAQAKWNERVTFYLSRPETSIKREITSGGLYLQGSLLHFVLANRQIMYGIPAYGMIYDKRYPMRPTGPKGFNLYFDDGAAVIEQRPSWFDILIGLEKDELIIDLNRVQEPPALVRATPATAALHPDGRP